MKRRGKNRRDREGGFALLLVFLMAAVIGIVLYMQVPRLAFESQRQREQLLIERGQQYQIAIRRYMQRGLKQGVNGVAGAPWPAKIEDLENTNGRRFLRKRYIDPMTGTDEWRLIHINNGILTDSVNNKQQNTKDATASAPAGITDFSQAATGAAAGNLAATRRRSSDNPSSGGSGGMGDPNASGDAGTLAGTAGATGPTGTGGNLGDTSSFTGTSSSSNPSGQQLPGVPGAAANSNFPGGVSPFQQPGGTIGQNSDAAKMINNLLTQPRPTGMPQVVATAGNSTIGGGIAGIASNLDADAIMVCGDHTNYKEWEFIFDPNKWRAPADPRKTAIGTAAANLGSSIGNSNSGALSTQSVSNILANSDGAGGTGQTGTSQQRSTQTGAQSNIAGACGMEARPGAP